MKSTVPKSSDESGRNQKIRQTLGIELVLNVLVAVLKIIYGILSQCMVLISDGIHSLSDAGSNVVGLIALAIAANPADRDHPYGHRKFETIASFIISFVLFFAAVTLVKESIKHLYEPQEADVTLSTFLVMIITLLVNIFVALWERRRGKELQSDFLIADSWHTLSDVFVTISVLAALGAIRLGIPHADSLMSFGIAIFICFIAGKILVRSSDVLCDKAVFDAQEIRELVMQIGGVEDCHEVRSRGREDDVRVDLHVLVDPKMSVEESHDLANLTERRIRNQYKGVTDVLVHIEPIHHDHRTLEAN